MSDTKPQLYSNDLIRATITTVMEPLKSKNLKKINHAMNQLQIESENLVNQQFEKAEFKVDCKINCTYCCHNQVSTTPIEIILLADYIKENFSVGEITSLKLRIDDLEKSTGNMNAFQRKKAQKPCALLVDNKCSVYSVRPLSCKGWNSMDVKDCESGFYSKDEVNIRTLSAPMIITNSVSIGISNTLKNTGLNPDTLELNSALKIALAKYNAGEKYLDGKNIFKEAKLKV